MICIIWLSGWRLLYASEVAVPSQVPDLDFITKIMARPGDLMVFTSAELVLGG